MPVVLIEAVVAAFGWLVRTQIGRWILSALAAIGMGFATQSFVIGPVLDYINSTMSGVPSDLAEWMGYLNIDIYLSTVLSAYSVAAGKRVFMRKIAP